MKLVHGKYVTKYKKMVKLIKPQPFALKASHVQYKDNKNTSSFTQNDSICFSSVKEMRILSLWYKIYRWAYQQ